MNIDKQIYIYGAGKYGVLAAFDCEKKGIKVAGFIDREAKRIKTRLGLPVFAPEDVIKESNNIKIIIAIQNKEVIKEITETLLRAGLKMDNDFSISPLIPESILESFDTFEKNILIDIPKNLASYDNDVKEIKNPLVTVVVFTYNHIKFIRSCLNGILMQKTNFPFEIYIFDDCSMDGTSDIVREYAEKYPNIIADIQTENLYTKHPELWKKKVGYNTTGSKYIAFCDGDDYWIDCYKLQIQYDFMENHSDFSVCSGGYLINDESNGAQIVNNTGNTMGFEYDFKTSRGGGGYLMATLTKFVRTEVYNALYDDIKTYKKPIDVHISYNILKKGKGFYFSRIFAVYNKHEKGIWSGLNQNEQYEFNYNLYSELYFETRDEQIIDKLLLCSKLYFINCLKTEEQQISFLKKFFNDFPELFEGLRGMLNEIKGCVCKNKISYYDLQNMELILWGEEKIRLDTADFFGDLNIADSLSQDADIIKNDNQTIVICSFSPQSYIEKLLVKGMKHYVDFITIEDMILTTDELELYNNAVNHRNKKIVVCGTIQSVNSVVEKNPNIKIEYILNEENAGKFVNNIPVKSISELVKEHSGNIRIICACNPDKMLRNALNKVGLVFGKDFYFHYDGARRRNLPSPSQLLRKTMQDKPKYKMNCKINHFSTCVNFDKVFTCWITFDKPVFFESLAYTDVENMVYSIFFRILQLATANKTYSFCSSEQCPQIGDKNNYAEIGTVVQREKYNLLKPEEYTFSLNYDLSCNLCCITCRLNYATKPENEVYADMVHQTVIENIMLMPKLIIGHGEMFYSKYYREIIFEKNPNKEIRILTNGILFNEKNWQKLRNKYDRIKYVNVSVDAATKETYSFVRKGNFDKLLENLELLSKLRKSSEIEYFIINFTIGTFNFREMKDFVKLGKRLGCDIIDLHKVRYFSCWNINTLHTVDVYDERNPNHKEFLEIISDPIFRDKDVWISDKRGIEHLFKDTN